MEVTEKLKEAEEQCKDSLQSEWEQCRPCLEDACKTFYTSTCRRGFGTFQAKVWKTVCVCVCVIAPCSCFIKCYKIQ